MIEKQIHHKNIMEITYDLSELGAVARSILENTRSRTILFYGEMGAGKTTLIKQLLAKLGIEEAGSSPTFSLVNVYEADQAQVNHFDFYRIEDESEAYDIGLDEYLQSESFNFIEWPEKIPNFVEEEHQKILIEVLGKQLRKLKFS